MSNQVCSICGEGQVEERIGENTIEYKGQSHKLPFYYSECDCCGSEFSTAVQLRLNKRLIVEVKKEFDGLLSGTEVREIRTLLGLNKAEAARIFGGGPVAFSKYEVGDVAQSEAMDNLLRVAKNVPEAFQFLVSRFTSEHVEATFEVRNQAPFYSNTWRDTPTNVLVMQELKPQVRPTKVSTYVQPTQITWVNPSQAMAV
ncbi:type II toxin-antitoxin system MqsA family antitoxin [Shewanella mangrovisoli]|uniref:type II toxin-antitoxin system MqsA family antitoxin n=1 Tax=Shewanella mangrovisoli TaxID=2864211 RepID=UPI0035B8B08D